MSCQGEIAAEHEQGQPRRDLSPTDLMKRPRKGSVAKEKARACGGQAQEDFGLGPSAAETPGIRQWCWWFGHAGQAPGRAKNSATRQRKACNTSSPVKSSISSLTWRSLPRRNTVTVRPLGSTTQTKGTPRRRNSLTRRSTHPRP